MKYVWHSGGERDEHSTIKEGKKRSSGPTNSSKVCIIIQGLVRRGENDLSPARKDIRR